MEYQPKKIPKKKAHFSLSERLSRIPKTWYMRSLPILFFVLVVVGTSLFAPSTLQRVTDFLGLSDTFRLQTSETITKKVYICTDVGWEVETSLTDKLADNILDSLPVSYSSEENYIVGQMVVNYNDKNEILLLDETTCKTACGSYDKGLYYDQEKSGSLINALTADLCVGGANVVPDSVSFSLAQGRTWQCGIRNTKIYADCSADVAYCGDKKTQEGELCDDGNDIDADACTNSCKENTCGDNIVFPGVEECDDGNTVANDGCYQCKKEETGGAIIGVCVDGDIGSSCTTKYGGSCGLGIQVCKNTSWTCVPQNYYSGIAEVCGDKQDNNCDGQVDEGCDGVVCCIAEEEPGVGNNPICVEGATCCSDGTWKCNDLGPNGIVSTCGIVGEGNVCVCVDKDKDGSCDDVDCNDANGSIYPGAKEICDSIDNDCDGEVDEGCGECPSGSSKNCVLDMTCGGVVDSCSDPTNAAYTSIGTPSIACTTDKDCLGLGYTTQGLHIDFCNDSGQCEYIIDACFGQATICTHDSQCPSDYSCIDAYRDGTQTIVKACVMNVCTGLCDGCEDDVPICENPLTKQVAEGVLETTGNGIIDWKYALTNGVIDTQINENISPNPQTCHDAGKLLAERVCKGSTLVSYDWTYNTCQLQSSNNAVHINVTGEVVCCEGSLCEEGEETGSGLGYCRDDTYRSTGISNKSRCSISADCGGEYCMFPCYDSTGKDYPWAECAIGDIASSPSVTINLPIGHTSTAANNICVQALGAGAVCGIQCKDTCENRVTYKNYAGKMGEYTNGTAAWKYWNLTTNQTFGEYYSVIGSHPTSCEDAKHTLAELICGGESYDDSNFHIVDCDINQNNTYEIYAEGDLECCVDVGCQEGAVGGSCTTTIPGICEVGVEICTEDKRVCIPQNKHNGVEEVCKDNEDNDCDGEVDEGCEEGACCLAAEEPGVGNNPYCFEGATCCADGTWKCNDLGPNGIVSTCGSTGEGNVCASCPPIPDCAAPPEGCYYGDPSVDSNGCMIGCGELTCDEPCPLIPCAAPPEGCYYGPAPVDSNQCVIGCGELICEPGLCIGELPEHAVICPDTEDDLSKEYPWTPAPDGCGTTDEDVCEYICNEGYHLEDASCVVDEHNSGGGGNKYGGNNSCGDGVVRYTEECDDGNGIDGDGCSHNCEIELGEKLDTTPRNLLSNHLKYAIARLEGVCAYDDINYKDIMFRDVKWEPEHEAINTLLAYCIVKGYDRTRNKKYYIDAASSKAEVIKVLAKTLGMDEGIAFDEGGYTFGDLPYKDMRPNHRYTTYVIYAYQSGLLRYIGKSSLFGKDLKALTPITKIEFKRLLKNAGVTKRYDVLESYGKYVYREDMANIMVDAFSEKFRDYQYLYGNNIAIYKYLFDVLEDKSAKSQITFVRKLIGKLEKLDHWEAGEKLNIHLKGLISFLKLLVKYVE